MRRHPLNKSGRARKRQGEAPAEPRGRGNALAQRELRPPMGLAGRFPGRSLVAIVVAVLQLTLVATMPTSTVSADDDELVTQFLDRLGLTELEIIHLEAVVGKELGRQERVAVAKKLADLYAGELMNHADDEQESADLLRRIQTLVRTVPEADTPSLRVMLLQADYNHAESLVTEWIADPANVEARDQAGKILARITPPLNDYQEQLNSQVDTLTDLIDDMGEGSQRDAKEKDLLRLQAVLGRATYYAGWSNYYLGLTNPPSAATGFQMARDAFRRFLGIENDSYDNLDAEWLGLESGWRSGAMIGLGLAEAATGNLEATKACFQLLQHASVPLEIQDQASYWYVQGLLNAGRYGEASSYAKEKIAEYTGNATKGKVSLCVSLVRAAYGDRSEAVSPEKGALGVLGLEGLARLGQQQTVRRLMEKYHIKLPSGGGFFLRWIDARRLLVLAERSKTSDDYQAAAEALTKALAAPDANQHISAAAQCRYELGWCHYQLGQYEKAGRQYEQAVTGLKATDAQTAAQSAWMAFASYQKLSKTEPRFTTAALEALRTLKSDFPEHPYAKRADYYLERLQQNDASPKETIGKLRNIGPDDPSYLSARYDICLLSHQLWRQATNDGKADAARDLFSAVNEYLAAAGDDADDSRKLKCSLLAADAALNGPQPDEATAAAFLDAASPLAERLPESHSLAAEYHYRRLQMAGRRGDDEARRDHADWLVQHAAGSIYERPALIVAAKAVDDKLSAATDGQKQALNEQGYAIYSRLAQLEGTSSDAISASKNARIATSKLAYYATQLGRFANAAQQLEKLLAVYPKDKTYLRRAGLAHFHAGDYERSLPHWRTLLSGLPTNTEGWYEAKYYQLSCLFETDPETAASVLRQFRLLHPELGPSGWKDRFAELVRRKL